MTTKTITIGTDYTSVPGGRYIKHGEFSGEHFRETVLVPALRQCDRVEVFLDGTKSYMSSFLEEAFGGLIRERGYKFEDLKNRLSVVSRDPKYSIWQSMVEQDMRDAADEAAGKKPKRVA